MELDEQMHNKFTSLKSLFKSTDSSKHFHGNKPKKIPVARDEPDPSKAILVSKSNSSNAPASMSFKDKLLSHYKESSENPSEPKEKGQYDKSTRIYRKGQTANYAAAGIHLYAKGVNPQIKKMDDRLARREKEITGSDSVAHSREALMGDINREHELNYQKMHQQQHHREIDPRFKVHTMHHTTGFSSTLKGVKSHSSMHDPQAILNKQNSTANRVNRIKQYSKNVSSKSSNPSHSVSKPTPVTPITPKVKKP